MLLPSIRGLALFTLIASYSFTASAGTVAVPFRRRAAPGPSSSSIARRDGTIDLNALNNITAGGYYAELGIGTPPQRLSFLLDTGSSDTWVNSVDADLCRSPQLQQRLERWCGPQCKSPSLNPEASSTFTSVNRGGFDITYLDQKNIGGDYFNDSVTVNGKIVNNQKLGLALSSSYPTVIDNMVQKGIIDAPVFSLFLDDLDAKSGTILFGGIDSQKYHGKLATLPLISDIQTGSRNGTSYTVRLRGFEVDGIDLDNLDAAAILDSGSTISLLPDYQVQDIYRHFGVRSVQGIPIPLVDCAYRSAKGKGIAFNFKFDGANIRVPVAEMIRHLFGDWERVCIFGVGSAYDYGISSDRFALLGDTFLRSAYVVYDMANRQLGIAQANTKADKSNIVEIRKGDTQLPDIAGVPGTGQDSAAGSLGSSRIGAVAAVLIMVAAAFTTTML
ncbi:eukaryotic aspartyl protease domain-containing protein [Hirsutella rhossiliensis]|uniref:Eukaryotic aspartyl protease domain-containing protein n=1 Tax=Hirsutella rhossiliensis TaxID=111463 RepID=A0A9P8SJP4_9HYPO|nr:eukaryotic aspartyl protease domain-containing protein [Hirsutella rhossiliensis]KAH0963935.1 eukaryotic aspartyl protease domain-containing protein [Hirsutella rhossiliensis]